MSKAQYIDTTKCLRNITLILMKNGKQFETYKELINFALEHFTPQQIEETLIDMPFCEDKQKFWYAAREAFALRVKEAYQKAWKEVCPQEQYEKVELLIDRSFNETVGIFDFFFKSVDQYATMLKTVEECGAGDIFRMIGGL